MAVVMKAIFDVFGNVIGMEPMEMNDQLQTLTTDGHALDEKADQINNRINVTINDMEFLGSYWRIRLGHKILSESQLIIDLSINAKAQMEISLNKIISIELPPDRLWVF